ncbi:MULTISPECIES: hypothetical protein [unclassified Caballeronia]|uniref:hypothetical protein n=1 Tax=unclassified Caballeronia TaxID=2646786 RepID=UPI0028618108|nr:MULTISPECIES: hypothetical protein [unclassified Caballeronia]MDR5740532.1 hypothetical protein [Caballeronia sp. LZ016]MDR5808947.1 hypothetical protein [Caballeronia sp. LZ019]
MDVGFRGCRDGFDRYRILEIGTSVDVEARPAHGDHLLDHWNGFLSLATRRYPLADNRFPLLETFAPDRQYVVQICYAGDLNVLRPRSADNSKRLAEKTFAGFTDDPITI